MKLVLNKPQSRKSKIDDVRCSCGSLLARWVCHGLELKCRRCRHLVLVGVQEGNATVARRIIT